MKRRVHAYDGISQQPLRRPMEAHANRRRWCCPPHCQLTELAPHHRGAPHTHTHTQTHYTLYTPTASTAQGHARGRGWMEDDPVELGCTHSQAYTIPCVGVCVCVCGMHASLYVDACTPTRAHTFHDDTNV